MSDSAKGTQRFAPPIIEGALPDIPDGQHNLLHRNQLNVPLSVIIHEAPITPPPPPGRPVEIQTRVGLRGAGLANAGSQFVVTPIQLPVPVKIHPDFFISEGIYEVQIVLIYAGLPSGSESAFFEVDKTAPNHGSPADLPIIPDEVIRDGLTTEYLEQNQDRVIIKIPRYRDQRRGDGIQLFLGRYDEPVSTVEVNDSTLDTPIELKGDAVRKLGNGDWAVFYTLRDRAGNEGPQSRSKLIEIKLT